MLGRNVGILLLACVAMTSPCGAATLSLGQQSGMPGDTDVSVPVSLCSAPGEEVAGAQFDIVFDDTILSLPDVVAGPAASDAVKYVYSSEFEPGMVRVIVMGLNQTTIADGVVARALFTVADEAPVGAQYLSLTRVLLSDPYGLAVPSESVSGSVYVGLYDADTDSDGDGISDASEGAGDVDRDSLPNYLDLDSDGDGYTDRDEVLNGVSATDEQEVPPDNDADFVSDLTDDDDDNDDLADLVETSTGVFVDGADTGTDPLVADTDGDGLIDGDEVDIFGSDPTNPDSDSDGLTDGDEVTMYGTDPNSVDTDGDGYTDRDEVLNGVSATDKQAVPPDNDGDFVSDLADQDDDNDGLADVVETSTGVFVDATDTGTDPFVADTDGDGLTDGDEVNVYTTDPTEVDTDEDQLSDADEINVHGTNPLDRDTDGDGASDGVEINAGTDPLDEDDKPPPGLGDVNGSGGTADAVDVQLVINAALGLPVEYDCDLNEDDHVNAIDIQLVVNAALGIT